MTYKYEDSDPKVRAAYFVACSTAPPQHDQEAFNVLLEVIWGVDETAYILQAIAYKMLHNDRVSLDQEMLASAVMDGK